MSRCGLETRRGWIFFFVICVIGLDCLLGSNLLSAQSSQETKAADAIGLQVATFDVDMTPPVGTMMAYDRVKRHSELGLRGRGLVLLGAGDPIVLCAIDWIGIANEAHDTFRQQLAKAATTSPQRVAVHCLHQHDAPRCDFTAERLLHAVGSQDVGPMDSSFPRVALKRLCHAVQEAMSSPQSVTHLGYGSAEVQQVASNRRILGSDGKVRVTRYTATRDAAVRAEPIGTIDPELSCLTFWNEELPIAALTYYACHPQSYYRTGVPSPDFPGIARFIRGQDEPQTLHVHFNGAGGNIGAGKFNDGSPENRIVLAGRVADAMRAAWQTTEKVPLSVDDVRWQTVAVRLDANRTHDYQAMSRTFAEQAGQADWELAAHLAWANLCREGREIEISCLILGDRRVLHLPGELFVEFQLAAKKLRSDCQVMMAAYGDYGPGYIGTSIAYQEGGYEASARASRVDDRAEPVLMDAITRLINDQP